MDSEDEAWLESQAKKLEITPKTFEEMIDRLEKGSGQQVSVQTLYIFNKSLWQNADTQVNLAFYTA